MPNIAREDNEIVLRLSAGERIMAMHRGVRVPLSTVTSVDVVDEPIRLIQGLKPRNFKVFGGYGPGWVAYGSFFDGAVYQLLFAALNGRKPRGLEITLDGARYTRLIDPIRFAGPTPSSGDETGISDAAPDSATRRPLRPRECWCDIRYARQLR